MGFGVHLHELGQPLDDDLSVLHSHACFEEAVGHAADGLEAGLLGLVKESHHLVEVARIQVHLGQVGIRVLIVLDFVERILRQHFGLDFVRFERCGVEVEEAVEDLDADLAVRALLHLLV